LEVSIIESLPCPLSFWAKKNVNPETLYPLLYHMMDVAAVTSEMWETSLHAATRRFCCDQLKATEQQSKFIISFFAGLHDIGKLVPAFQKQSESTQQQLKRAGFDFPNSYVHHGIATAAILPILLKDTCVPGTCHHIAVTIGGHHGVFPRSKNIIEARRKLGNELWAKARSDIFMQFSNALGFDHSVLQIDSAHNVFFMLLAGLISIADWIGSNETYFPYTNNLQAPENHLQQARNHAKVALKELGWTGWKPPQYEARFDKLFPSIQIIRPLQAEIINIANKIKDSPGLVIIEAPMGEGKTEAAMYLADAWLASLGQKGCYFALPTQATSNQMFGRVKEFLNHRYHDESVNMMLLHGHAALSAEFEDLKQNFIAQNVGETSDSGYDTAPAGVVAGEWFTYRKRGLLSPFGVGTIDQALLSILQTKHVFVRLFGLANKTVIIDEVHAYDAYMSSLLEYLLKWLAALDSSVILLSATLPESRRCSLLAAYQDGLSTKARIAAAVNYPRITWITQKSSGSQHIATSSVSARKIRIDWVEGNLPEKDTAFDLGIKLQQSLAYGGCAVVICNTVDRAQKVYMALKNYFPGTADDGFPELDIFHARYLFGERDSREKRTLLRFGKAGSSIKSGRNVEKHVKRPSRTVLIATQVIEQSLDLDFDLMVTDMAPIDLILQRTGRLQRHARYRPTCFQNITPTLWICQPGVKEDHLPDFGRGNEQVYEPHILLRSLLALKNKDYSDGIRIPDDVEKLIEAVYGDNSCPADADKMLKDYWTLSYDKLITNRQSHESKAATNSILPPNYEDDILDDFNCQLEEDKPDIHETLQALTRLSDGTVNLLCLYDAVDALCLDYQCNRPVNTHSFPNLEMTKELLSCSVAISHKGVMWSLKKNGTLIPESWRNNPLLRHHYLLCFNRDRRCLVGEYSLNLRDDIGLEIVKL